MDVEALFRRRLRKLIKEKYRSLDRFYLETDFSKGHLSEILRGKGSPSVSTLVKLAAALGVRGQRLLRLPQSVAFGTAAIELLERASLDQVRRVLRLLGGEQEDE